MKENNKTTCDPCEQDFKRKVDELVREGKAPDHTERSKREHEVKAAFTEQHPHHSSMHGMEPQGPAPKREPAMSGPARGKK